MSFNPGSTIQRSGSWTRSDGWVERRDGPQWVVRIHVERRDVAGGRLVHGRHGDRNGGGRASARQHSPHAGSCRVNVRACRATQVPGARLGARVVVRLCATALVRGEVAGSARGLCDTGALVAILGPQATIMIPNNRPPTLKRPADWRAPLPLASCCSGRGARRQAARLPGLREGMPAEGPGQAAHCGRAPEGGVRATLPPPSPPTIAPTSLLLYLSHRPPTSLSHRVRAYSLLPPPSLSPAAARVRAWLRACVRRCHSSRMRAARRCCRRWSTNASL